MSEKKESTLLGALLVTWPTEYSFKEGETKKLNNASHTPHSSPWKQMSLRPSLNTTLQSMAMPHEMSPWHFWTTKLDPTPTMTLGSRI